MNAVSENLENVSENSEILEAEYILPYDQAARTTRDCVCAGCWNHLMLFAVKGSRKYRVTCPLCGDGRGFVSKRYAERQQAESMAQAIEARQSLKKAVPWVSKVAGKSSSDLLKELGF